MPNDERLNRIEERLAWLERHVIEQDRAMLELSEDNARLRRELAAVLSRVSALSLPETSGGDAPAEDERPPHY